MKKAFALALASTLAACAGTADEQARWNAAALVMGAGFQNASNAWGASAAAAAAQPRTTYCRSDFMGGFVCN